MRSSVNSLSRKRPLSKSFYLREAPAVARDLLGKGLLVKTKSGPIVVEISEVEAYLGKQDPASHSHNGLTKRNWPMFEAGGMCYVYFSYGMHFCMNVVTGGKGAADAVLLRGAVSLIGLEMIEKNRGRVGPLNGPGKLTKALGIDLRFNGRQFDEDGFKIIDLGLGEVDVEVTTRIGISKAIDLPLRFLTRKPFVFGLDLK